MESTKTLVHGRSARGAHGPIAGPGEQALVLGRYRLRERLGAGGFGVVWRAHDELLHREVAVKRIPLAPDGDSGRAQREALAAARLAHPAIVALFEACAAEDAFYLISELVDGQTLAELMAAGTLEDEQLLHVGMAIAAALAHAHSRGVIHRDIKPQNVLVPGARDGHAPGPPAAGSDPGAVAKLTDFGGARLTGEDVLTRTGDVLGTLAYMAPEQCEGGEVGAESDLYSLALVLYEALSGVNPVRGATPAATARRIGRRLPSLARWREDLPPPLTHALDAALSPDPGERGTPERLGHALEQALEPGAPPGRPRQRLPRRGGPLPQAPLAPPEWEDDPAWEADPEWEHGPDHGDSATPARRTLARGARPRFGLPPATAAAQDGLAADQPLDPAAAEQQAARPGRVSAPRALWLAGAIALAVWQLLAGRPGAALVVLAAGVPLVALPRRAGPGFLTCALAPVLGLAGLAGAFPAVAGQARGWRERAALGALGYWWLGLAGPLLGRRLWLGPPAGAPARAVWEGSLQSAAAHVVGPLLVTGTLLGALLWGAGALALPWIVRGRSAALDVVGASVWSAAIAAAAPLLDGGLAAGTQPSPRGAVLGAVFGGVLAVAARALRGPV